MQGNAQGRAHCAGVFEILGGAAVAAVDPVFPVFHEQAVHLVALFKEQQGGDRGIDATGETDDDAGLGHGCGVK